RRAPQVTSRGLPRPSAYSYRHVFSSQSIIRLTDHDSLTHTNTPEHPYFKKTGLCGLLIRRSAAHQNLARTTKQRTTREISSEMVGSTSRILDELRHLIPPVAQTNDIRTPVTRRRSQLPVDNELSAVAHLKAGRESDKAGFH